MGAVYSWGEMRCTQHLLHISCSFLPKLQFIHSISPTTCVYLNRIGGLAQSRLHCEKADAMGSPDFNAQENKIRVREVIWELRYEASLVSATLRTALSASPIVRSVCGELTSLDSGEHTILRWG